MKVSIIVTNRFVEFLKPYPYEDLLPYFSFYPPNYHFMPSFRMGRWNGKICLLKRNRVPTGLFFANLEKIKEDLGVRFGIRNRFVPVKFRNTGVTSDRPYQNECVERMIEAAQEWGGGLVLAATGVGKTRTAGQFFSRLVGNGCFIVDELTLLKQAQQELSDVLGEEVGEIGDSKFLPKRITVATSQTLHLHEEDPKFQPWVEGLQVNIIDELHVAMNRRNFAIVEATAPPAVFGLTATLELQKKHIRTKAYALTGPVCYEYPLTQGQEEGHLSQGVVVQVLKPTFNTTEYDSHQFAQAYTDIIVNNPRRNTLICRLAREAVKHKMFPTIVVERIKHLQKLSDMLEDIPHRVVCGKKTVEERLSAKRKFEQGKVKVLLVNKVFQKGIDIKRLDVIIDGGAMKGKNRAIQVFGRGIRLCEGKAGLLYFDIGDTENRFEKAAKSRRLAFKKKSIPLKKVEVDSVGIEEVGEIFEVGERFLKKVVQKASQLALFSDEAERKSA